MSEENHRKEALENPRVIYHPDWIKRLREDPFRVLPIYIEISPSGACNHRCTFCSPEMLGYKTRFLDLGVLAKLFEEMQQLREDDPDKIGFKSIQLAGEGEPMLHKQFGEICQLIRSADMDLGILSNGTILTEKLAEKVVPLVSGYMQFSVNGGTAESYSKIHQAPIAHWDMVWRNIKKAMEIKRSTGISDIGGIGVNMTLLVQETTVNGIVVPSNWKETENIVIKARESGVDYISIKPYSQDSYSKVTFDRYGDMTYRPNLDRIFETARGLIEKYSAPDFEVIFRFSRFVEENEPGGKAYPVCLATPTLWGYIQSDGAFLSCSQWTNPNFIMGNIYESTLKDIWFGEIRRKHLDFILNKFDLVGCRKACHPEKENRFLTRVKAMSDEEFSRNYEEWKKLPHGKMANFI
jgi:MoaA/NifB/PqqE/SkfB family radical SAM enzyme